VLEMALTWTPHIRVTFGGTIGTTTTETWSNTIRFYSLNFVPTLAQLQAAADALETPVKSWFTASLSGIASTAKLSWIKVAWINADGKQRDQSTIIREFTPAAGGGGSTTSPPWYQTVALTFRTRIKRGRAHAGRIFPPVVNVSISPDQPYITAANAGSLATQGKNLLTGHEDRDGDDLAGPGRGRPGPVRVLPR
jgi:hypothetical protein